VFRDAAEEVSVLSLFD